MKVNRKHLPWVKAVFHLFALAPIIYLFLLVFADQAGGDPVQFIIHYTGIGALNTLLLTLLISPAAKKFKMSWLMQTRRLVGLYVFAYATLHVASYFSFDLLFEWSLLGEEVIKRPYILVGAVAYLILFALSVTSFKKVMAKMGHNWQKLHNWVYFAVILISIHFYWSVKSEIIEPSIYIFIGLLLVGLRFKKLTSKKAR
ncbi:protein-methionine-sulfoxide reductase heme-binding subunit MsrQ [Parashewanella spongiae]|uniref:Protein-methionine-sulfoxide reductase heme-binding subunit MsrQ n=1 Tax=Parashewanella spongiae TaxID=342950 RepID=A0A3A6TX46_9GAMM|nr:protein-methionine-sulfoxide reductase heme-binding subunit MsrQ [Parashewanella spongiae]MCL1078228.1 protein-methionine-sulfoxide reductase heme-binding subunit MsrQ [Parashewanella spongiae]RJY16296.1 protein-methionine-sulfoxide reductase heme-binding subunit MsrQ [Parashewanella spongiae]